MRSIVSGRRGLTTTLPIVAILSLLGGFAVGHASGGSARAAADAPFGFSQVVFLSHPIAEDMPIWPGDPRPRIESLFTVEQDGFRLNLLRIGEQSGTHWAAPCHFNLGELCADQMDPADFFHPAVVVDVREQTKADPDFRLRVTDVEAWEATNGAIPEDAVVIMWTGFENRWGSERRYRNIGPDGLMHFPGFSGGVTKWLIANRGIGGLGIDTLGVDPGTDEHYRCNTNLLKEHRIHIENMAGLAQMPPVGGWLVVGGLRDEGGSGSPATVFGLVP
jgi:kynurenine formamidase